MRFLLLPLLALASPQQILIKSQLFIDGKLMSSPTLVVNEGKEATISERSKESTLNLRLVPTKTLDGNILMSLNVEYFSGLRTIRTNQIFALSQNEETDLNLGSDSHLKITASQR